MAIEAGEEVSEEAEAAEVGEAEEQAKMLGVALEQEAASTESSTAKE